MRFYPRAFPRLLIGRFTGPVDGYLPGHVDEHPQAPSTTDTIRLRRRLPAQVEYSDYREAGVRVHFKWIADQVRFARCAYFLGGGSIPFALRTGGAFGPAKNCISAFTRAGFAAFVETAAIITSGL